MSKPKTETRYKIRGAHPEFESAHCHPGDEFTVGPAKNGIYPLTQVGMKKTIKLPKVMFEMFLNKKYLEKYEYEFPLPPNEDIILAKGVKLEKSTFDSTGGMLDFKLPKDCDLVILMGNRGGGYVPFSSLLPHQVYLNDLREVCKEEGFEVIYAVGIKSDDPFHIAFKGEYGKQRWEEK